MARSSSSKAHEDLSEEGNEARRLPPHDANDNASATVDKIVSVITVSPAGTRDMPRLLLKYMDTPPSYHRQSSLPSYALFSPLSTTVSTRYTVTSADAARATRKLVRAYRRNLMVHNVPWNLQGVQHPHHGPPSAAASARAIDRPSNATRHWKLLEARSKSRLRPYVTVLSHEATSVTSPHAANAVEG